MSGRPDLSLLADLVPAWTRDQIKALDEWRQGDLLACPPVAWSTTPDSSVDPVTGRPTPDGGIVPWAGTLPKYVIVTTQTCDVCAKGPGARQPFVQVSPVVRVADATKEQWDELTSGQLVDRYGLTGKRLRSKWAVDLRISFPISKALLLDTRPVRGFASYEEAIDFGAHLALRAGRPALHDFLLDVVRAEIHAAIKSTPKKDTGWWSKVEEVRLAIRGDELAPKTVGLVVVSTKALSPDEHDRWIELGGRFKKRAKAEGIAMKTTSVMTLDEMPARVYRDTVALDIPSLGR